MLRRSLFRRLLFTAVLLSLVASPWLLTGCGGDSNTAQLRVVHVSSSLGSVDLAANGSIVQQGIPEASISAYVTVPSGKPLVLTADHAGTTTALLTSTATLNRGSLYEAVLSGTAAAPVIEVVQTRSGFVRIYNLTDLSLQVTVSQKTPPKVLLDDALPANGRLYFTPAAFTGRADLLEIATADGSMHAFLADNLVNRDVIVTRDQSGYLEVKIYRQ